MIKIIINGEAHNSPTMPKLVLKNIGMFNSAGKRVIIASEDEGELENKVALREYADKMQRVKSELEEENPALFTKICGEDDGEDEEVFSRPELNSLREKITKHGLEDYCGDPMDLVERIAGYDNLVAMNGGYERIKSYAELFCEIAESEMCELFTIDGKPSELRELLAKSKSEEGLSDEEMKRLQALYSDPEIERERVSLMSKNVFEKCMENKERDVVLYVYPIGSSYVERLATNLHEMLSEKGVAFSINAHRLWDEEGQKESCLKEDPSLEELFSGGRAVDLVLSNPDHGGYDKIFSAIISDLSPRTFVRGGGAAAVRVESGAVRS